jgi:hypothetical protein
MYIFQQKILNYIGCGGTGWLHDKKNICDDLALKYKHSQCSSGTSGSPVIGTVRIHNLLTRTKHGSLASCCSDVPVLELNACANEKPVP